MPRLNEMPRLVLLLVCGLSRAVWAGNPVTGEICADRRATETCAATQDVVLVVDNSGSVSDRFDGINEFLSRFVDRYELDANSVLSPRIGIVTFDSAFDSSKSDSARVLFPLTNNAAKLQWAISTRPGPHHNRVWTCISCGIDKSTELFSWFPRDEAMPLIIVLTDGEQSVHGGDEEAIYAADNIKADGVDVVTLSLGQANAYTMNTMASLPPATYSRKAETVDELLDEAYDLVPILCTESLYACRMMSDCRDPVQARPPLPP